MVSPVSKASAAQRAGRAGRTRPGKCYRLYTPTAHSNLADSTVPEIQRSNLAPVILQLKTLGIDNILRFDYMTAPPAEIMTNALEVRSILPSNNKLRYPASLLTSSTR